MSKCQKRCLENFLCERILLIFPLQLKNVVFCSYGWNLFDSCTKPQNHQRDRKEKHQSNFWHVNKSCLLNSNYMNQMLLMHLLSVGGIAASAVGPWHDLGGHFPVPGRNDWRGTLVRSLAAATAVHPRVHMHRLLQVLWHVVLAQRGLVAPRGHHWLLHLLLTDNLSMVFYHSTTITHYCIQWWLLVGAFSLEGNLFEFYQKVPPCIFLKFLVCKNV